MDPALARRNLQKLPKKQSRIAVEMIFGKGFTRDSFPITTVNRRRRHRIVTLNNLAFAAPLDSHLLVGYSMKKMRSIRMIDRRIAPISLPMRTSELER